MSLDTHSTAAQSQACPRLLSCLPSARVALPSSSCCRGVSILAISSPSTKVYQTAGASHHWGAIVGVQHGKATPSDHTTSTSTHSWEAGISARLSRLSSARARQSWEGLLAQSLQRERGWDLLGISRGQAGSGCHQSQRVQEPGTIPFCTCVPFLFVCIFPISPFSRGKSPMGAWRTGGCSCCPLGALWQWPLWHRAGTLPGCILRMQNRKKNIPDCVMQHSCTSTSD